METRAIVRPNFTKAQQQQRTLKMAQLQEEVQAKAKENAKEKRGFGINMVTMAGRLAADPESVETRTSTKTTLRIATNEKSEPEFHSVVLWGAQAQTAALYLKKGSKVLIQGRIHNNHWTDKDGVEHIKYEIEAFNFQFLDAKSYVEEAA